MRFPSTRVEGYLSLCEGAACVAHPVELNLILAVIDIESSMRTEVMISSLRIVASVDLVSNYSRINRFFCRTRLLVILW